MANGCIRRWSTNAKALIEVIRAVPKDRHLCLEEGPHSNWLYEVLSPHVQEIVVALVNESRGPKSDKLDAFGLAEQLRIGAIRTKVYKKRGGFGRLGYRVKAHALLVADSVRVQSRIKALFRSRGVAVAGGDVYSTGERGDWLSKLPQSARSLAELLFLEYDGLEGLRQRAEREMITETRKHDVYRIIQTCPGIGEIRAAQILPVVVTPYRFANKRVCVLVLLWFGDRNAELIGLGALAVFLQPYLCRIPLGGEGCDCLIL